MAGIVVVGAGQAGASLVAKLRTEGFDGPLTLIGEEPVPPYQRPPLSKKYLLGEMALERLFLRPERFYADHDITLRLGSRVEEIDPQSRSLRVGGEVLAYDQLAMTTGSVARRLPAAIGGALAGVHVVRTIADVDRMAPEFAEGRRVLIVGGGYIGLEAAAVAAQRGLQVTLVEAGARILQRVAAPATADHFRALHAAHGVAIVEGVGLARLDGTERVARAELTDGRVLDVDFVIAGVGIAPATALAEAAGLAIENGIRADAFGRTSAPGIWAAGDCASFPYEDGRIRLESVQNAIDQAECVARNMLGAEEPYRPVPWFWSDQYDAKLQIVGLGQGHDRVVRRVGAGGSVSHWYFAGEKLLAVDAVNDPRAYMVAKRLLEAGRTADSARVADAGFELKGLLV